MDKSIKCQVNNKKKSSTHIDTYNSNHYDNSANDRLNDRTESSARCQRHLRCYSEQSPPKHSITMTQTPRVEHNANVHRTHLKRLSNSKSQHGHHTPNTGPSSKLHLRSIDDVRPTTANSPKTANACNSNNRSIAVSNEEDLFRFNRCSMNPSSRIHTYFDKFSRFYMIFVITIIVLLNEINCDQGECS